MSDRQLVWSVHEGGTAVLTVPPMGVESLAEFEAACAIMFRGMRRSAMMLDEQDPGSLEYLSWAAQGDDTMSARSAGHPAKKEET